MFQKYSYLGSQFVLSTVANRVTANGLRLGVRFADLGFHQSAAEKK